MTLEGAPSPTAQAPLHSSQAFADACYVRPESSSEAGSEDEEAESFDSPLSSVASFDLDKALQRLAIHEQDAHSPYSRRTPTDDVRTASTVFQSASPGEPGCGLLLAESGSEADTEGSSACLTFARGTRARSSCHLQILSGAMHSAARGCCLHCCACTAICMHPSHFHAETDNVHITTDSEGEEGNVAAANSRSAPGRGGQPRQSGTSKKSKHSSMPVCRLSFSPAASPAAGRQCSPEALAAPEGKAPPTAEGQDASEEAAETLSLTCSEELDMGRSPAVSLSQQLSPVARCAGALHSLSIQVQLLMLSSQTLHG